MSTITPIVAGVSSVAVFGDQSQSKAILLLPHNLILHLLKHPHLVEVINKQGVLNPLNLVKTKIKSF